KKLYDALPEWDRLGSYHFWGAKGEDGQRAHWRIPRPLEAGFLFGTIPEEFYLSLSKNAEWKEGIQHIGQGISSQLGFNPIGQAVRPLYDAARNE
ncbi:LPD38 domain-containing protein, partial [Acinetobacter baumannii]|uniref:LPD38 domain-containing protein n=1 Tax=Acinetobacter baumannii TaxID=470 RepID=UPI003AF7B520